MSKMITFPAIAAALSLLAIPAAQASTKAGLDALTAPVLLGKHGADDPAGDDRGGKGRGRDDGAGHAWNATKGLILARRGADDPAGDDRGGKGRGADDGAGHASNATKGLILARRGADDPAGDDRGGKGRGTDDGANHT